jgi:hypothetical protein
MLSSSRTAPRIAHWLPSKFSKSDGWAARLLVPVCDIEFPQSGTMGALGDAAFFQQLQGLGYSMPGFSETKS